jgi:hypothetical protein
VDDDPSSGVLEVLDGGVRAWKEQGLVTVIRPTDQVRGSASVADVEHFPISVRLTDVVPVDHDSISNACPHDNLLNPFLRQLWIGAAAWG